MGENNQGKRDGTGPHKQSYQRNISKIGKRQQSGQKCPIKSGG